MKLSMIAKRRSMDNVENYEENDLCYEEND